MVPVMANGIPPPEPPAPLFERALPPVSAPNALPIPLVAPPATPVTAPIPPPRPPETFATIFMFNWPAELTVPFPVTVPIEGSTKFNESKFVPEGSLRMFALRV